MDTRVELLDEFYQSMRKDKVKLENKKYGFNFVNELTATGATLDYIQLDNNFIHKYRLLNISESLRKRLLQGHVNKEYNICLYFDEVANNTLCFNLDNNFKAKSSEFIPEMEVAVQYLQQHLEAYDMETVSIKSGRGYHVWCRFENPIANQRLYGFMLRIAAKTLASLQFDNYDYHTIKFNFSPNPKVVDVVSLRAFGSRHIKTGNFTHVQTKDGILDEEDSWTYLREYMLNKTIPAERFLEAYNELAVAIPL